MRADEAEFEEFVACDGGRLLGFAVLLTGNATPAPGFIRIPLSHLRLVIAAGPAFREVIWAASPPS
jgi:hypothetical protein